jgi:hypothetical protein
MPALTGLHPRDGRLRRSYPLGDLRLRQSLRGASLEELVQQRELVGQLLELRADRILSIAVVVMNRLMGPSTRYSCVTRLPAAGSVPVLAMVPLSS